MRRRTTPSSNPLLRVLIGCGILVGGGLLTFAGLSYFGFIRSEAAKPETTVSREGMIKVPRTLKGLTALSKVRREDIYDLAQGDDSYFWMEKARLERNPEWITDPAQVIGRVMARNKDPDKVFTERDFLPEGSRTGISAGVPDGKQGFFVDAEKIPGLELLRMGDTFDLLASLPDEAQEKPEAEYGLLAGGIKVRGGKPVPLSGVRQLVQDAQMVAITRGRDMSTQSVMGLPEEDSKSRRRDQAVQITIAIDPAEVVPLTQALAAERAIHCVAKSGRTPGEAGTPRQSLDGLVAFPATARSMEAFTRITADDLADPETGELRMYYFRPGQAGEDWVGSVNDLIGRVVARDTTAGYIFTPEDLLPAGAIVNDIPAYTRIKPTDLADPLAASALIGRVAADDVPQGSVLTEDWLLPTDARPGVTGGTPAGRMAISISNDALQGVSTLQRGDRFDLLASAPFRPADALAVLGGRVAFSSAAIGQSELADRARNTVLAEGVVVVEPGEEMATIAVRPEEAAAITKAITLGVSVYALARSGRSGSQGSTEVGESQLKSDPDPIGRLTVVDEMVGGKRTVRVFAEGRKK